MRPVGGDAFNGCDTGQGRREELRRELASTIAQWIGKEELLETAIPGVLWPKRGCGGAGRKRVDLGASTFF